MHVWGIIRQWFQQRIEAMGVEETSFPLFLSSKSLEKEKDHVEGFAPELAWVTKAGDKDLEVPVAVCVLHSSPIRSLVAALALGC